MYIDQYLQHRHLWPEYNSSIHMEYFYTAFILKFEHCTLSGVSMGDTIWKNIFFCLSKRNEVLDWHAGDQLHTILVIV